MRNTSSSFFSQQVVFLTGATGGLGGCLLYKLSVKLDTSAIYVLVRGSAAQARAQWAETMPSQVAHMLSTGKIKFVIGDMRQKNCGIDPATLAEMAERVTLVLHCAANISLKASLQKSVQVNCIPTLALAQLAAGFTRLSLFVHVSTAYVNAFLPDGVVEEKIYHVGNADAESHLAEILKTGSVSHTDFQRFPTNYNTAKYLTERLLRSRYPRLPLLIVRPTMIGPAVSQPYPYYGPIGACPLSNYTLSYMQAPDSGIIHVSPHTLDGSNILDEIPVDIVANLVLLHAMKGPSGTGIVHASAQSYVPRSLAQLHADILAHVPHRLPGSPFRYVADKRVEEGKYGRFWIVLGRDWHFSNTASSGIEPTVDSPLHIDLGNHDVGEFMATRARILADSITSRSQNRSKL